MVNDMLTDISVEYFSIDSGSHKTTWTGRL